MAEEYWKRLCRSFNEKYVREIETRLDWKTAVFILPSTRLSFGRSFFGGAAFLFPLQML